MLGAARLSLKLSVQFNSNLGTLPDNRALVVDVRTRRSVPISAAGDAVASSWSVSQTDPSATLDRVSDPRNNVGWRHVRVQALATEQF